MLSYQEMFRQLNTRIHQFAKRQETWFRRMERQGMLMHWIAGDDYGTLKELMDRQGITLRPPFPQGERGL